MTRKAPLPTVIKALFARSGNECAFPGCTQRLVNQKNQFIGQLCHIEAANAGGERYNEHQNDDDRRAYENLILFCYPHHIETNDVRAFSLQELRRMKSAHEQKFQTQSFNVSDDLVSKLMSDMESYWRQIEVLNTIEHDMPDLAIEVNAKGTFREIIALARGLVKDIEEVDEYFDESDRLLMPDLLKFLEQNGIDSTKIRSVPYYENPFVHRNWEMRNLRLRNDIKKLRIALLHVEIKFLEEYLKVSPGDATAAGRFEELKNAFKEIAQKAIHVD